MIIEGGENYERALMKIDGGVEHTDRSVISSDADLQKLDQSLKDSLLQHQYFLKVKQIMEEVREGVQNGVVEAKIASSTLASKFEELGRDEGPEANWIANEKYLEFRQAIWKCRNADEEFTDNLIDDPNDDMSDEDEIRVMGEVIDVKCPLSVGFSLVYLCFMPLKRLTNSLFYRFQGRSDRHCVCD
jgi:hypothetical protein